MSLGSDLCADRRFITALNLGLPQRGLLGMRERLGVPKLLPALWFTQAPGSGVFLAPLRVSEGGLKLFLISICRFRTTRKMLSLVDGGAGLRSPPCETGAWVLGARKLRAVCISPCRVLAHCCGAEPTFRAQAVTFQAGG